MKYPNYSKYKYVRITINDITKSIKITPISYELVKPNDIKTELVNNNYMFAMVEKHSNSISVVVHQKNMLQLLKFLEEEMRKWSRM